MARIDEQEELRRHMEKQMRQQIASLKGMFETIDLDALDLGGHDAGGAAAFGCFGSAGTIGCLTGCFGTAGTFGSASYIEPGRTDQSPRS